MMSSQGKLSGRKLRFLLDSLNLVHLMNQMCYDPGIETLAVFSSDPLDSNHKLLFVDRSGRF